MHKKTSTKPYKQWKTMGGTLNNELATTEPLP